MQHPRFIVTGGGTGGHIYPALAVAGELRGRHPEGEILYVGAQKGLEKDLVPREGYEFRALDIRGMERKISFGALVSAFKAIGSVGQAMGIIRQFRPDAVIGTGGYASFPVGAAAVLSHVPLILHEQNVYPGLANRMLGRFAKGIAISWEESRKGFGGKAELIHSGNPIRQAIVSTTREEAFEKLKLSPEGKTVLVFGGSQGAVKITDAALGMMELYGKDGVRVILATGKANWQKAKEAAASRGIAFSEELSGDSRFFILDYLHDMAAALAASDLVVCRSGALTLAEITARGIASVLIPHPYVPDDVQRKNAYAMQKAGSSVVIENADLDGKRLFAEVSALIADPGRIETMAAAARKMAMPDAAGLVADLAERHMLGGGAR